AGATRLNGSRGRTAVHGVRVPIFHGMRRILAVNRLARQGSLCYQGARISRSVMSKNEQGRPKARVPRGFADARAEEIRAREAMIATIKEVYELYGFEPLETSALEYTDALGKFL